MQSEGEQGRGRVDEVSIEEFEADLRNNLYKVWNRMSSGRTFGRRAGGGDPEGKVSTVLRPWPLRELAEPVTAFADRPITKRRRPR